MTTTTVAEQATEVDAGEQVTRVEDLPDDLRQEIVAQREAGTTLAELKANFPQVDPAVIREVLPPANQRERKARQRKPRVDTRTAPGSGPMIDEKAEEAQETPQAEPKAPRYATDLGDLPDRVLAAREVVGRTKLAELLGVSGSAVWRHEHGRTHPTEVAELEAGIKQVRERIAAGEFVKAERQPTAKGPSKADLEHRIEVAVQLLGDARAATVNKNKNALIDQALDSLAPKPTEDDQPKS